MPLDSSDGLTDRSQHSLKGVIDTMQHRHLTHQAYTLAAIDDIIGRGKRQDWAALRTALLTDPTVRARVLRVCAAHVADPYAQRYHFWKHYAERNSA
jgi:hypothetical protein